MLIPGYDPVATAGDAWFEPSLAARPIEFFGECLTHVEGSLAGQPFVLEPWQAAVLANAFGWVRRDEIGRTVRRFREVLLYIPRKNGKTPLAAGICNFVLFCDGEAGAQIYGAAADTDQATLLFKQAAGQVENEPELASRARVFKGAGQRTIAYDDTRSAYKVISSVADTKHGFNLHLGMIDELHVQQNRDLVDVMLTSTASLNRAQPMMIYLTTADFEREGSICNEKHDYACKVRDGVIDDPSFLPVVYEATREDDWTDEAVWERANPNLGVSVSREYLRHECRRAQETTSFENTFKRLHLNIRTENDVRWIQVHDWDLCCDGTVAEGALLGRPCYAGLDLSSTMDLSALVLFFPEDGNAVLPWFWVPEKNAHQRERKDRVPYIAWSREDAISLTPGNVVDQDRIRTAIGELGKRFDIREIAIDRWNSTQIQTQLIGDGFEVVQFGQGYASMTAPTKELERLVVSGNIRHNGHPVLRWNISNMAVEEDAAGNIKPNKKKATEKIDGGISLIMAIGRALVATSEAPSVYNTRGLRWL